MDSSDFPVSKSPRRELQGPRPAPLKVRKDSYKIRKPPVAPQPQQQHHHHHHQQQPQVQPRPPVIIYTVSPKVIHTNPSEFMTLVQRLTGSSSSSSTTSSSQSSTSYDPFNDTSGAISPAARYASIEKAKTPEKTKQQNHHHHNDQPNIAEGIEMDHNIERSSLFPGILSPGPTALPMISPGFFSPPTDPNSFSFFHDLSPALHSNKNFMEGTFMPSPSSFLSPHIPSPTPSLDYFNNLFNFD